MVPFLAHPVYTELLVVNGWCVVVWVHWQAADNNEHTLLD